MRTYEHTPGPYTVRNRGDVYVIEGGNYGVGRTFGNSEQDHANAVLMAKAPELVDALLVAYAKLENHSAPGIEHVLAEVKRALVDAGRGMSL